MTPGIVRRIARPDIESGERLGRHRWKIERSVSGLFAYSRLSVRYERKGSHFLTLLILAAPDLLQETREMQHVRQALNVKLSVQLGDAWFARVGDPRSAFFLTQEGDGRTGHARWS